MSNEENNATEMHKQSIVTRLREASRGQEVWRVQDKDDHSYCIEFAGREEGVAYAWWNAHKSWQYHANHELIRVRVYTQDDRLMQEAAEFIDRISTTRFTDTT